MKIGKRVLNGFMVVTVLSAVLLFSGCGNVETGNIESNNIPESAKETWETGSSNHSSIPEYLCAEETQANYTDIRKLPAEYSEEMAIRDGVVVKKLDEILNQEVLYQFCDSYAEKKDAMVRVMLYTTEGDPIVTDISYRNNRITMTTDSSRDRFGAENGLEEIQFQYLVEHNGLLYLSKNKSWEDNDFLFAYINDKDVWRDHLTALQN